MAKNKRELRRILHIQKDNKQQKHLNALKNSFRQSCVNTDRQKKKIQCAQNSSDNLTSIEINKYINK